MLAIYHNKVWRVCNELREGRLELRQYRNGRLAQVIFALPENVILDTSPQYFDVYSTLPKRSKGRRSSNVAELTSLFS